MHCTIHIDGGSRGNPGPAGAGVVIVDADDGTPLHEAGYYLGRATNNVAEYEGLVRALELAHAMGARQLTVNSDSQLMVRQINGEYRVKSSELRPLFERVQSLLRRFDRWSVAHVARELNARADALANRAMDAKANVTETDGQPFTTGSPNPSRARRTSVDQPAPSPSSAPSGSSGSSGSSGPSASSAQWTVTLVERGEGCPADQPVDEPFTFGPTTPAGCCVHAAAAAFAAGVHQQGGKKPGRTGKGSDTRCERCGGRVAVRRLA